MKAHILQHVPFEGLGSIQQWLDRQKYTVTYTHFFDTAILPPVEEVDLLIVLGGPMSVNDEQNLSWLRGEKRFIAEAIASGKPVLGICLGAQLIASALGASVYRASESEIGWFPVYGLPKTIGAFSFPEETNVFHWHGDTFDLPSHAIHLAKSAVCQNQAFQIGPRAIGLQFHLEVTPESVAAMVTCCSEDLHPQHFIQTAEQLQTAASTSYAAVNLLMEQVLDYLTRPTAT